MKVSRALISVYDKAGILDFSRGLSDAGVEILSSGGTARKLGEAGVPVTLVEEYTGSPEMLDGRVKTIHPKIHGGILARRGVGEHESQLEENGILTIDLVVVNLYPFQDTVARVDAEFADAIEMIDIGGPTLIRAAAKNHADVGVVVDPADYGLILAELQDNGLSLSGDTLRGLAVKAFAHTASYDSAIHSYLSGDAVGFPDSMILPLEKVCDLRYGENWHQKAAFYRDPVITESCITNSRILSEGKGLSFNNLLDLNSALELVKEFENPAAVIVKHLNPSGVGESDRLFDAYSRARGADPTSAFGCIVAFNRKLDVDTAKEITTTFVEAVVAPEIGEDAFEILGKKEKMRVFESGPLKPTSEGTLDYRKLVGGMVVQESDVRNVVLDDLEVVSERQPSEKEFEDMLFAWKVCRHVKSNSIIFAKDGGTVGVGAGQMSRVDAVKIAAMKAGELAEGSSMASDAFFPFRDGIDEAAKAGVTAVIQPGGSIRDEEVLEAVNEHEMSMVYTGVRCFLH